MNPGAALRAVRRGRDKAAYYRTWHLQLRAGLPYPENPSPGAAVPFETALVALGKESGKLEECLHLLSGYFTAEDRAVQRVLRQAAYPMFTALVATFIGPLPLVFLGHAGAYLLAVTGGLVLWASAGGSLLLGVVHRYLAQAKYVRGRLLRALTAAIEAGLPLGRAATLAAEASGSADIVAHVRRAGARAAATQPLARTFAGCPMVTREMLAAMEVADASGDYAGTLQRLAMLVEA